MTVWLGIIAASLLVWGLKNSGYVIPQRLVEGALISRIAGLATVALLASLVVAQALQENASLVVDARVPAVGVAAALLYFKAPFLLVLLAAGLVAGGLRFFGLMP
ncbi:MAG: AzlD domain-containing protein [Pontimonas sp.]